MSSRALSYSMCLLVMAWVVSVCGETELSEDEETAAPFGYYGAPEDQRPEKWDDNYPICGQSRQSPINIVSKDTTHFSAFRFDINRLQFHYHKNVTGWIVNNGHTVEFRLQDDPSRRPKITGGLLDSPYDLIQFHWHWGSTDDKGSEHTINERRYAAELHFVHINEKYNAKLADIETNQDGVAVLGVFVEIGNKPHEGVEKFLQYIEQEHTSEVRDSSTAVNFTFLAEMLPQDTTRFYRYLGSLTTPPCYEVVIWTLFEQAIQISPDQIQRFRRILAADHGHSNSKEKNKTPRNVTAAPIVDNFRPLQPVNGRTIFSSFPLKKTDLIETTDLYLHNWGYYDNGHDGPNPNEWSDAFEQCAGERQSPIHIEHANAIYNSEISSTPWDVESYKKLPNGITIALENNGHTAVVLVGDGVKVSGGGLPSDYRLIQFHWHWGSHNFNGSEHFLDGKQYPAELHLVHANKYYGSNVNQIEGNHDGLAVLGVFIEIGDHNSDFDPILARLEDVKYTSDTNKAKIEMTSLHHLLPDDMSQFYRYYGSLTTPPCNEIVIWTVFKQPITMSQVQLDHFRSKLYNGKAPRVSESDILVGGYEGHAGNGKKPLSTIVDNFRPVQPVHDRLVYYAKMKDKVVSASLPNDVVNRAGGLQPLHHLFTSLLIMAAYLSVSS